MERLRKSRLLIPLVVLLLGIGVWIGWSMTTGDDPPPEAGGEPADDDPGGAAAGGGTGEEGESGDSDGDDGGSAAGGATGTAGGSNTAGGSSGGSTDDGGDSTAGAAGGVPTASSPTICGPAEFIGGLAPFVKKLGSPDLLPDTTVDLGPAGKFDYMDVLPLFVSAPVIGPIVGALATPYAAASGFNKAYMPIADALPDDCAGITGDPHVSTVDGLRYDFQAVGEYWALRSDDGTVQVQVRTTAHGTSDVVSSVKGVAAAVDGHVVVVDATAESLITIDGKAVSGEEAVFTDNGGSILVTDDGVAVYWPDGFTTLSVDHLDREAKSVHFTVHESLHGKVSGLIGNADGDPANDLAMPDGSPVDDDHESIHGAFRDAWRVADEQSLFEGPSAFQAGFPSAAARLTNSERAAAREICVAAGVVVGDLLDDCALDVGLTGDESFAEIHAENQRNRILIHAEGCELDTTGEIAMEGLGPERTWEADPIDISGDAVWVFDYEDGDDPPRVRRVMPVGSDRLLVVDSVNGVHITDAEGGVTITIGVSPIPGVDPLVVGETALVATEEGLAAIGTDGSICWHLLTHSDEDIATLGYADGVIIATTEADDGGVSTVLAIDPDTGDAIWSRPLEANVSQFGAMAAPAISDGVVVVEAASGGLVALDVETGDEVWAYGPDGSSEALQGISIVDSTVLFAGRKSGLTALGLATGEKMWDVRPGALGVPRALAVADGVAIVQGEAGMRAVDTVSGIEMWFRDDLRGTQQPVVAGDVIIALAKDRQVIAVDLRSGAETWRIDADLGSNSQNSNRAFVGAPVLFGDVVLIVDSGGVLEAYR